MRSCNGRAKKWPSGNNGATSRVEDVQRAESETGAEQDRQEAPTRRRTLLRALVIFAVAGLLGSALGIALSTNDDDKRAPQRERTSQQGVVTSAQARGIPLGISREAVLRRLGPPFPLRQRGKPNCIYYAVRPHGSAWEFCFRRGRLSASTSVAVPSNR